MIASAWVFCNFEPGLFTVGYYDPAGKWHPESDHTSRDDAAERVHYLNGGARNLTEPPDHEQ